MTKREPKRKPIAEHFAENLVKRGDEECWGWTGPTTTGGYPTLGRGGKGAGQVSARELAFQLAKGESGRRGGGSLQTLRLLEPAPP